jgi:hypothetical protein
LFQPQAFWPRVPLRRRCGCSKRLLDAAAEILRVPLRMTIRAGWQAGE